MILINANGVALYAGKLTLTESELRGDGFVDKRLNTSNAELVDVPTPANFKGRGYTWDGSRLTITPRYEAQLITTGKKELLKRLKTEYTKRLNAGVIDGVNIGDVTDQLQDAAISIGNGITTKLAVVSDDAATLINGAKLNTIYTYKGDCSTAAIAHRSAIQALNNINDIENYDLSTGWPSEAL